MRWLTDAAGQEGVLLQRRGTVHGRVAPEASPAMPDTATIMEGWQRSLAVRLPGMLLPYVSDYADAIADALTIMRRVRHGESCVDILDEAIYQQRLQPDFELLAAIHSGHDMQEIEKIAFDAVKSGELFAEDLWMKVSCLSFFDEDDSIRFRFSYGMEMFKDQEDDPLRERLAAELAERVFPECAMVTRHAALQALLQTLLGFRPDFVERIIYSNAPQGGAQFHQDVEHGHHGVVYAQLHGRTAWLALPREVLLREIDAFMALPDALPGFADDQLAALKAMAASQEKLVEAMESDDQGTLEILLNHTPAFTRQLVEHGWGLTLHAGDVLLLPQHSTADCCWHSVFCLDDEPGHSLSFALAEPS